MSEYITFEVKGLKEMGDQLAQLPAKIARRALAVSTFAGARVIREAGRSGAPVGTKTYKDWRGRTHHPGYLRKFGVVAKKLKTKDWRNTVIYGVGFSKRGYYGKWYERGKDKKHHQAAKPWIVPLLDPMREQIVEAIKARLGEEIRKIARGIPGLTVK
jgi:hypothetical protein